MLLRDCAAIIRRDSEMGKIRLKADLKLPVEMLNLFLTHCYGRHISSPRSSILAGHAWLEAETAL